MEETTGTPTGTFTRALASTLLAGLIGATVLFSTSAPAATAPLVTIDTDIQEQRQMAEWAVARFAEASLHLPALIIEFPGKDLDLCDGAQGRTYIGDGPTVVKMCWNDPFILLHELGHAWAAANVPEDKHDRFMAMRTDVDSWSGAGVPWDQLGGEHAANVIAWGLLEKPYPVSRTYPNDPDSLTTAFEFLTDADPLHDGGPRISQPDPWFSNGRSNDSLEMGR